MSDVADTGTGTDTNPGTPYTIRRVAADEWERVRDLRLEALLDPVAPLAFLTTYEEDAARPEEFWRQRAAGAATGGGAAQFVVVAGERWVGTAVGLLEDTGSTDFAGHTVTQRQVHIVGVWLHTDHRGRGLIQEAIDAAIAWGVAQGAERARLYVHVENVRAQGAYAKAGFTATGLTARTAAGTEVELARPLP